MPILRRVRPAPPRETQKRVDAVLNDGDGAPEEPLYRADDLERQVRKLAAQGASDERIGQLTGIRSLARVARLRKELNCPDDPQRSEIWDQLAASDDEPPEAA